MLKEVWKRVAGTMEPITEVSSHGRLRQKDSVYKDPIFTPYLNTATGDLYARLLINGVQESNNVAKLVARAFLPNPKGYLCVNHIDGNNSNNHLDNLQWGKKQNSGRVPDPKTQERNDLIRRQMSAGVSGVTIANRYNLSISYVSLVKKGER